MPPQLPDGNLRRAIVDLALAVPTSVVENLASNIANLESVAQAHHISIDAHSPTSRPAVERLIAAWSKTEGVSPQSLSLALIMAREVSDQHARDNQLELVWTGPLPGNQAVRRINGALFDLVESANSELLLVTFVAYPYPQLSQKLRDAVERGVKVTLVLESPQSEGGQASHDPIEVFADSVPEAVVYRWPVEQRLLTQSGNLPTLHAKCAVADDHSALLSSANFTAPAMESNMEMGVFVKGTHLPGRIRDHFTTLIERRTLIRSE